MTLENTSIGFHQSGLEVERVPLVRMLVVEGRRKRNTRLSKQPTTRY